MSPYVNAALMLAATLAGFAVLAKLLQLVRSQRAAPTWWRPGAAKPPTATRLRVEQACVLDGKRRLLLIRCDEQRVLLLTGGAADLVVAVLPGATLPGAGV